jgi:hypothetical protein
MTFGGGCKTQVELSASNIGFFEQIVQQLPLADVVIPAVENKHRA